MATTYARFEGECPHCGDLIAEGDAITKVDDYGWVLDVCAQEIMWGAHGPPPNR